MAKYVNQDVFDASVLLAAADYVQSGSELQFQNMVATLVQYYQDDYSGDYKFGLELKEAVPKLIKKFDKVNKTLLAEKMKIAAQVRMELDDNMKQKSSLKKMFGGTAFTSGHSSPALRLATGLINTEYLVNLVLAE
jgi:hypothetical protein